ncbi:Transcription initiation protein spt3 [Malassezia vespertilionis]|uniref:Transcription initiation protein spt3 n=1 Tax=Malassezia vespertilionis TaxID=2020962 RepID=UPI0024B11FD7|nr:Transcription initiation protein spt3 [Malassezia vespertilionis]WFD07174.1 Transcription initiation protein spt3 [Malassezia vespertilionis]
MNEGVLARAASADAIEGASAYKYQQEIAQMVLIYNISSQQMFVSTEIENPDPQVTRLIEDIVRNQVIEMSRKLAARRTSKYLSPEDLLFLIRYDRAKVNRLRTYLSWKDVRKNAKDSGGEGGGGAPAGGEAGEGLEETVVDGPLRVNKRKMRLPWELSAIFSDYPRVSAGLAGNAEDAEEEDEDTIETNEDSLRRLKAADDTTRRMTRDEYVFYSECRQASFTFRKAKRFREFIHAGLYLDVKPSDDTIDILGFLAFEVVHELCTSAVRVKTEWEGKVRAVQTSAQRTSEHDGIRSEERAEDAQEESTCTLFSMPPRSEPPLEAWHIREAFAQLQHDRHLLETGRRTAGPSGGLRRTQVFVI